MKESISDENSYLPEISGVHWEAMVFKAEEPAEFFSLLAEPLHEELYRRQTFNFVEALTKTQQAIILLDYVRTQVAQGGFIQLIQNGYVGLLVPLIEACQEVLPTVPIVTTMDNALKIYALNREQLDRETSVEEFAMMYDEFKEFENLDVDFSAQLPQTLIAINAVAIKNPDFVFKLT